MSKRLLYIAPIAVVGSMAVWAPATAAVWSGGIGRNIAAVVEDSTNSPLVLVQRRGGGRGGGGSRGGGGYAGGGTPVDINMAMGMAGQAGAVSPPGSRWAR
jgi:hypothetical protein